MYMKESREKLTLSGRLSSVLWGEAAMRLHMSVVRMAVGI
jgi:hypothetical protein